MISQYFYQLCNAFDNDTLLRVAIFASTKFTPRLVGRLVRDSLNG